MPDYSINSGLPQIPVAQDEKTFSTVLPLYQALNTLAQNISKSTGLVQYSQAELSQRDQLGSVLTQNHRKVFAKAVPATLEFGRLVNLWLDGGKIAARYADASTANRPAHGIVNNPEGIADGTFGEVLLIEGLTQGIGGTVLGSYYYLSTNGQAQLTRPSASGSIVQTVGFGLGSAGFYMHISSFFSVN